MKMIKKIVAMFTVAAVLAGAAPMSITDVAASQKGLLKMKVSKEGYTVGFPLWRDVVLGQKGGKFGIAKLSGKQIVPFIYDEYLSIDHKGGLIIFKRNLNPQSENDRSKCEYVVYNSDGKVVYKFREKNNTLDNQNWYIVNISINDGLLLVTQWYGVTDHAKNYLINREGKIIQKNDASEEWMIDGGNCLRRNWEGLLLNNQPLDIEGMNPFYFKGNYIYFSSTKENNGSRYAYTHVYNIKNKKTTCVRKVKVDNEAIAEDSYFATIGGNVAIRDSDSNLYGIYTVNGRELTEHKYSTVEITGDKKRYYLVEQDGKWLYVDKNGREYGRQYLDVGVFSNGRAIVLDKNHNAYVVDTNFKKISESVKADGVMTETDNSFAYYKNGKKYPFILESGNIVNKCCRNGKHKYNTVETKLGVKKNETVVKRCSKCGMLSEMKVKTYAPHRIYILSDKYHYTGEKIEPYCNLTEYLTKRTF